MKYFYLALGVPVLMGTAAIFEKLSLREASPLGVFTLRSILMTALLLIISLVTADYREYPRYSAATYLWIAIPALLATAFLLLYFTALKGDLASRIVPVVATAPIFTLFYAIAFLGEPMSWKRLGGAALIVLGVWLVK